jgi:bacteriocin biosynthesis cyclodehydratase domain-containing protein
VGDGLTPNGDVQWQIAEGLDVVVISDNEVLIQFGSRSYPSELYRDTDLTGVLGQVFSRLEAASATTADILSWVASDQRGEVGRLIDRLCEQGILVDADKSVVEQYLGLAFSGETDLAARRVSLVGAGPVGAQTAELLLQHGVGGVRLLEHREPDAVWRALPRSTGPGSPGTAKLAQVGLRDHLLALGYRGVEAAEAGVGESLENAVAESDLVVVALEQPDVRLAHLVNRRCIAVGRPWLHVVIDGDRGLIGPLFVPGVTACYNDFRALADAATPSPLMARVYRHYRAAQGARRSFAPGLPAHAGIVGGFASLAAVHTLLTGTCFALGRVLTVSFDRMLIDVEDVLRLPRCPVCGRQRNAYHPPFSAEIVTRVPAAGEERGSG